ncbi:MULTISPECIES: DUF559 domain-containing protein [unclassified Microbacterium]|uniref:DUF559 domain-containing protein n=1 Tax=unclassified Microbacterium TaxID=2609290 RepID=UPI000EA9CFF9|nr:MULTISPECIES: DUF559 domain-containing protein [unclassified Microbacterium]MBT2486814.1 DUF559 domain-containing protein [Microbacterium sp. ISL-108]RKN64737.1 DUF559 domain-containing protein [Microbacterium sp. CGR2]
MIDAAFITTRHGGVVRGTLLQQFGISRTRLASDVRRGRLARIRPGVYASLDADPHVVQAAAHGGALTCTRALRLHGIWTLEETGPAHVWLGGNGRAHHRDCGCVGHYFAGNAGLGVAPLEDAIVHVYFCAGEETFFAAMESALAQRKISSAARGRIRRRLPSAARWLVDFARSDADSGLESLLRLRRHMLGIRLDCQVVIPTVRRVDFVLDDRLILEVDGKANHAHPDHRHRDLVRDAVASALGYETLRFDYAQIVYSWASVEMAVVAAVTRLRDRL